MSSSRDKARKVEATAEEYLPYSMHVAPWCVLMEDGSNLAACKLDGIYAETADAETVDGWKESLNLLLRNIARPGLILTTHVVRTLADDLEYPTGEFRSEFSRSMDAGYRDHLVGSGRLYRNEVFLFVQQMPKTLVTKRARGLWFRKRKPFIEQSEQQIERLNETMMVIEADLKEYGIRRLGIRPETRNKRVYRYSEIAEALKLILTGRHTKAPILNARMGGTIGASVYTDRMFSEKDTIRVWHLDGTTYAKGFRIKEYPTPTEAGHFDALLCAPYCFVFSQTFAMWSKNEGLALLTRKQNRMVISGERAHEQIAELDQAASDLISNKFVMGSHHLSLMVFADSREALAAVAAQAQADLADSGAVAVPEDIGLEACYWAQIPGNMRLRTTPGAISSRNFAGMAAMHNYPSGPLRGYWGDPVCLFRTSGGTSFRFHFHVGDLGNIFMSGPSRRGKTTLLLFLVSQSEKLGATSIVFDKDRGCEIAIRAMGGSYLSLPSGSPSGCSPLKVLTGSPEDIAFLSALIRACIIDGGSYEMTNDDERRLHLSLRAMMRLDPKDRSLGELRMGLGVTDPKGAGARLEKWCKGRELGWVLDNDEDEIDLSAPSMGFDMTKILDDAQARGPLMSYLFHRCESLIDGRRLVFVVDEFWKALLDESFREIVNDKLKTLRKRNCPVILATQSPRDAINSKIAHTIIEQCPTQIHMPNPRARSSDYVEAMGLTEPEYELVKGGMSASSRRFLVKQDTTSVVCELDLSGCMEHVAVLSGRANTLALMNRVRGDHPQESGWVAEFMREAKEMAE